MKNYEQYDGTLFDYTAGSYCGVLVKESVMKKLAKLQAKHLEDVKRLLTDEAERGNVFPSAWTLHYPKGKLTEVRYIDKRDSVANRIRSAVTSNPPRAVFPVFIAGSMDEARDMADNYHNEMGDNHGNDRSDPAGV